MTTTRVTLAIQGLSCGGGGALAVERSLARVPSVTRVYVNPMTEQAYIDCDGTPLEELRSAVRRAGYRTSPGRH